MKFIFTSPSIRDLVRILRAWRFWVSGTLVGAVLGAAMYYVAPPPYRARATVNVDFNLEEAWPQDTDRQQFYYLERESRKLEEIAWHDTIMSRLSSEFGISSADLRAERLHLSQPAEAGWHFYADDDDPQNAARLVSAWAEAFVEIVQRDIDNGNINEFVRLEVTQSGDAPAVRSIPLSLYLSTGAAAMLSIWIFLTLFFIRPVDQ